MSSELHPSIIALVSLAANIAANHPKQGLCQIDRLKQYGVSKQQIDMVVEIARFIRDEAGQHLDTEFDAVLAEKFATTLLASAEPATQAACCTHTAATSCC